MDQEILVDLSKYKNRLSLKNKLGRLLWRIVYFVLFRPFIGTLFKHWRNLILKCFGAKIKGDVTIYASAKIWAPWNLEIDTALISYNTIVYNVDKIIIGKYAVISHNVHLCTASHDITNSLHPLVTKPIIIESQSWVATEAFVGPGVTIGIGGVVGARSAVFKDVAPWTIVGGNPSKVIGERKLKN